MGQLFERLALEAKLTSPHFSWTRELTLASKACMRMLFTEFYQPDLISLQVGKMGPLSKRHAFEAHSRL